MFGYLYNLQVFTDQHLDIYNICIFTNYVFWIVQSYFCMITLYDCMIFEKKNWM